MNALPYILFWGSWYNFVMLINWIIKSHIFLTKRMLLVMDISLSWRKLFWNIQINGH